MSSSTHGFAPRRDARAARSRICCSRAWKPSSSVRNSHFVAALVAPDRSGRATVSEQQRPDAGPVALGLLGVGREVALERAADLRAVVAQLAERLLDLFRQQGFGQRLGRAEDGALATAVDALAARRARRTRCRRRWRRPCPGCAGSLRARRPRRGRRPRGPRAPRPARREPLGPGPGRHPFL